MAKKSSKRKWLKWLVLPALAVATFFLVRYFTKNPDAAERIYSRGIYPVFAILFSNLSRWLPFSLDDLFYMGLILFVLILLILLILHRLSFPKFFGWLVNIGAMVYIAFYLFWGFNYFRNGMDKRLGIAEAQANLDEFNAVFDSLVELTNQKFTPFDDFNKEEADSLIEASYKNLAPFLEINYPMGKRRAKEITFSRFFASGGISGYFGPFFNEVHVNNHLLPLEYPVILAHEKAHQFGITNEAEANFYAWLVCSQSPSRELQYSAQLYILNYFIYEGRKLESSKEIVARISPQVKNDIVRLQEHWRELRNEKIDRVATKANNIYLKTNQIKEGIENYTGVVKLVMDFSGDQQAQARVRDLVKQSNI